MAIMKSETPLRLRTLGFFTSNNDFQSAAGVSIEDISISEVDATEESLQTFIDTHTANFNSAGGGATPFTQDEIDAVQQTGSSPSETNPFVTKTGTTRLIIQPNDYPNGIFSAESAFAYLGDKNNDVNGTCVAIDDENEEITINAVNILRNGLAIFGVDDTATIPYTSSTLDAQYPNAFIGFRVYCKDNIVDGPTCYEKRTNGWISFLILSV